MFLKLLQNSEDITCAKASFLLKVQEKETLAQMCSSEFFEILRTHFYRAPPGDCLFSWWREIVRDIGILILF